MNDVYISSFYKSNISPYLLFYQKQVFKMLGIKLHQICNNDISHGDFMTQTMREVDSKYFVFFDIDCIPLKVEAIQKVIAQIKNKPAIAGSAQTANQYKDGQNIYVGPFFLAITKNVYDMLGSPDLNTDNNEAVDVGGILTKLAPQHNVELHYWYPTHVEEERWPLYPDKVFGIGTTYNHLVYHLFESRYSKNIVKFVRRSKCSINDNWQRNPLTYALVILNIQLFKIKMKFSK